ncbi:carbohydrate binding domain-containing protein [Nonomuraea sp. B12E4]|uniref:carbohydrate binding domain-containing protein n=1 Tax=Nonomuraea sp. B12E4 TaxID=3153564 RepID=UPI00325D5BBE
MPCQGRPNGSVLPCVCESGMYSMVIAPSPFVPLWPTRAEPRLRYADKVTEISRSICRASRTAPNIHYGIGGTWTAVPGVAMESACAGWFRKVIDLGPAATFEVTFGNGAGSWDNNGGRDYTLGTGVSTVANGVVTAGAANPCG